MEMSRDEFLHRCNVMSYGRQLRNVPDGPRRATLMSLLADELMVGKAKGWFPVLG